MPTKDLIEDQAYLLRRIREERNAAAIAENNAVALAHLKMAEEYERRASELVRG